MKTKDETGKIRLDHKTPDVNFLKMLEFLDRLIVGQNFPKKKILEGLIASDIGLSRANKPLGVFLLVGDPGTGKTLTVKAFAELLFGDPNAFVRINGADFERGLSVLDQFKIDKYGFEAELDEKFINKLEDISEKEKTTEQSIDILKSMLLDLPQGEERTATEKQLSEIIKKLAFVKKEKNKISQKNPYRPGSYHSILLIDGVDEMHSIFQNTLKQILDQGMLFGQQENISFKRCFIFMTTNILSEDLSCEISGKGVIKMQENNNKKKSPYETLVGSVLPKTTLIPELIKVIGKENILIYKSLLNQELREITKRQLRDISLNLTSADVHVEFSESVLGFLVKHAQDDFNKKLGASSIERIIEKRIVRPIVTLIRKGKIGGIVSGDHLIVDINQSQGDEEIIIEKIILPQTDS